jgi:hypothetical protein
MTIYILLIISDGALSEFNRRLGCVESMRSPSMFGLEIHAILVIWLDYIWTQLRHGLPVKQDMHQNLVHVKSLSSTWTFHRIHGVHACPWQLCVWPLAQAQTNALLCLCPSHCYIWEQTMAL